MFETCLTYLLKNVYVQVWGQIYQDIHRDRLDCLGPDLMQLKNLLGAWVLGRQPRLNPDLWLPYPMTGGNTAFPCLSPGLSPLKWA